MDDKLTGGAYHTREASLSAPKTTPNLLSDELPEMNNNFNLKYFQNLDDVYYSTYLHLLMFASNKFSVALLGVGKKHLAVI